MIEIFKIIFFLALLLFTNLQKVTAVEKIKIGLLVPLSGVNSEIGQSIVKATRLAINKIDNDLIEIIPKDTESNPDRTLRAAKILEEMNDSLSSLLKESFNTND